jgi:hypothetical protein
MRRTPREFSQESARAFYFSASFPVFVHEDPDRKNHGATLDSEVVTRAQSGDRAAQEELVRSVSPRLFRLALRMCGDGQTAEEIVHEALYRGVLKLGLVRERGAVRAWFCRILVNVWRDRLRVREREQLILDEIPEAAAPPGDDPVERVSAGELRGSRGGGDRAAPAGAAGGARSGNR